MPHISQELCNECASLLYEKWATAFDMLKNVKEAKDDNTDDWELFHAEQLKRATAIEARCKQFLNEITPLHTIGRSRPDVPHKP